jgi:hypothetical protein
MPRRARKRASQKPSRLASWVSMTRAILRPAAAHQNFMKEGGNGPEVINDDDGNSHIGREIS